MKTMILTLVLGFLTAALPAHADDAARDWSQSMKYTSASDRAVDYSIARDGYLLRKGALPGAVVNHNKYTTICKVAGSCQNGGSATNINGYSSTSTTITGDGNNVSTDVVIETEGTKQGATSVPVVASDVGVVDIN